MKGRLLAAVSLLAAASPLSAQLTPWEAEGGRVVINFHEQALEHAGLALRDVELTSGVDDGFMEQMEIGEFSLAFRSVPESDMLALRTADGRFQPYGILGGRIKTSGGFTLESTRTGRSVDFHNFEFVAREVRNDGPGGEVDPDYIFMTPAHDQDFDAFQLCYVKVMFLDGQGYQEPGSPADHQLPDQLRIKSWDLIVTDELANALGRPDLEGRFLGYGKIEADVVEYTGDWEHPNGQNIFTPGNVTQSAGVPGLDVELGILNSMTSLGHVGTFPNGRAGLSMATTSCNAGTVNVNWLAPMNEDHPGIAMQLYRELDGRFEQVGVSWVKHGFFALSNSQCYPCQNPSGGQFLGVGCSDTYGTGNNGSRFYLGPRDEWNVFDGTWACLGSYFDGTPADCVRSENGSGLNSVDHRLEAFDADLNNPGATYYYEAYYVVDGDQNLDNNIGSRRCTMSWNGNNWSFSTPGSNPLIQGAAVNRWGDVRNTGSMKPYDGQVILAQETTDLGNGLWRYEYALFNWNLERRVDSFSVPAQGIITNLYFHDTDGDAANDWVATTDGNKVTWTFPDVFLPGHKVAGPLEWGTLYNFGFTARRPPVVQDAALGIHDAGQGGDILGVQTFGPSGFELTSSKFAPAENEQIAVTTRGGTDTSATLVLSVNGSPIPPTLLGGLNPFVGGTASYNVVIPPGAAGICVEMIGLDLDGALNVIGLSNTMDICAWAP